MNIIKKFAISIAIIIPVPPVIYLISIDVITMRFILIVPVVIIALPYIWIEKKILKGNISFVELKRVNEFGDPLEVISTLEQNDIDIITEMFNKKAKLFFDIDFEYSGYALYVHAKKTITMYPKKNNMKSIKLNENTWRMDLSDGEAEALAKIINKYKCE